MFSTPQVTAFAPIGGPAIISEDGLFVAPLAVSSQLALCPADAGKNQNGGGDQVVETPVFSICKSCSRR